MTAARLAAVAFALAGCTTTDVVAVKLGLADAAIADAALADAPVADARVAVGGTPLVCICQDATSMTQLSAVGDVGVNGTLGASSASVSVSGRLVVAGLAGGHAAAVNAGALEVGGPLVVTGRLDVIGAAAVAGDVQAGSITAASFTVPAGATVTPPPPGLVRAPVSVALPCGCPVDVTPAVAAARAKNDDAAIGLHPADLDGPTRDTALTLHGGRYFVERIAIEGDLTLTVDGAATLVVAGDISTHSLTVNASPGSSVALTVGGSRIAASGPLSLVGPLLAPGADLFISASGAIRGTVFIRSLAASDDFQVTP